jgi:putative acetyltransferase
MNATSPPKPGGVDFRLARPGEADRIADLFRTVFTDSEGPAEGSLIGQLASDLMTTTAPADLDVFVAAAGGELVGATFITRMPAPDNPLIQLLAPVAVRTSHQRQGIGQTLIRFAIDTLRQRGTRILATYGDPAYYSKVGFQQVDPASLPPPRPLSLPHGWLAQSLDGNPITAGPCSCVPAFDNPAFW